MPFFNKLYCENLIRSKSRISCTVAIRTYKFSNAKDIKCIIIFLLNTHFKGIYFDGRGTKTLNAFVVYLKSNIKELFL